MRKFLLLFFIICIGCQENLWAKKMKLGGSDTGGGTGYYRNSQLHLIDFKQCSLDQKNSFELQNISIERISPNIGKLKSSDIGKMLENF